MRDDGHGGGDVAAGAAAKLVDLLAGAANFSHHVGGAADEGQAHGCQHHAAGAPLKELNAQFVLKLLHAARQSRLGKAEIARCGAQTATLGDRDHVAQLIEFHAVVLLIPAAYH